MNPFAPYKYWRLLMRNYWIFGPRMFVFVVPVALLTSPASALVAASQLFGARDFVVPALLLSCCSLLWTTWTFRPLLRSYTASGRPLLEDSLRLFDAFSTALSNTDSRGELLTSAADAIASFKASVLMSDLDAREEIDGILRAAAYQFSFNRSLRVGEVDPDRSARAFADKVLAGP